MPKTTYLKTQLAAHVFRTASYTKPSGIWIALFGEDPTVLGTQTSEVSGGSYARVQRNPGDANWSATAAGQVANAAAITFPAPTADWNSGDPIPYIGIMDASTAGNMLYYEALSIPKTVNNGDPAPTFPIEAFSVTET